jgi:hypothetical protein
MARDRGDYFQKRRKNLNPAGRGHLDKEKQRSQKNRELHRTKASATKRALIQVQTRERVRRYREKKAAAKEATADTDPAVLSPFANKASETKALQRVLSKLPLKVKHRSQIIYRLASTFCPMVLKKHQLPVKRPRLPAEFHERVLAFFLREDVSVTMPGHADSMVSRVNGQKVTHQKRFLTVSLKEAYSQFCAEEGKLVSLTFFCEQRPCYVLQRHLSLSSSLLVTQKEHQSSSLLVPQKEHFSLTLHRAGSH